jgi:transposase
VTARAIRTTLTELRNLYRRVELGAIEADDLPVLGALISKDISRAERRLAKMLAKLSADAQEPEDEATGTVIDAEYTVAAAVDDDDDDDDDDDAPRETRESECAAERDNSNSSAPQNSKDGCTHAEPEPKRNGHGRNGAGAYVSAKHCIHALLAGVIGAICEACGVGTMSRYRDKLIVVVKGQPLFGAETHHFEQARCRLCGAIITAEGGMTSVARGLGSSYITYDWSACAMLVVMHYFAGVPFKRMESLQAGWGIPMSDANQWTIADASADLLFPLYKALEKHGVNHATALRIDDTGSMVIEVRRKIRAEIAAIEALGEPANDVRTAINATGVYLETEQGKVLLFFTGRHHAGEIIDRILKHRHAAQHHGNKLVKVSDAASKNFSHAHHDELEEAVCNAHAYLKFRAVKDQHFEEYSRAGEVYKKVFDNDDAAYANGMSPLERLLYHRQHSLPEMKRLKKMCRDKLESKLVEPNSPLWEPLTFIINQWDRLTKFCEVPGVPLDTNVVEQMLIIPVRYLAGSFNYKTQTGADVGDCHMSLVATANANGVEPVAYLTECLAHHEDLATRPEYYLPWVYRARLVASLESEPVRTYPQSATSNPSSKQTLEHPLRPGMHRRAVKGVIDPPATTTTPP